MGMFSSLGNAADTFGALGEMGATTALGNMATTFVAHEKLEQNLAAAKASMVTNASENSKNAAR